MTHSIPAASIRGIDIEQIRASHPTTADEIQRLGALMERGVDIGPDFARLCQLLIAVGERFKAKELLLANSEPGDLADNLLDSEFPGVKVRLKESVVRFEQQFACQLVLLDDNLSANPRFSCLPSVTSIDHDVAQVFASDTGCEVMMSYEPADIIVADLYDLKEHGPSVPLEYSDDDWVIARGGVPS